MAAVRIFLGAGEKPPEAAPSVPALQAPDAQHSAAPAAGVNWWSVTRVSCSAAVWGASVTLCVWWAQQLYSFQQNKYVDSALLAEDASDYMGVRTVVGYLMLSIVLQVALAPVLYALGDESYVRFRESTFAAALVHLLNGGILFGTVVSLVWTLVTLPLFNDVYRLHLRDMEGGRLANASSMMTLLLLGVSQAWAVGTQAGALSASKRLVSEAAKAQ